MSKSNGIHFTMKDNGFGFSTNEQIKGMALKNIDSRVKLHSEEMKLCTKKGKGCKLEIFIPVSLN